MVMTDNFKDTQTVFKDKPIPFDLAQACEIPKIASEQER